MSTNWQQHPLVKWTAKYFFIGVAIKIAVLVSWSITPVTLCWSNYLQLKIHKRCSYPKHVACFGFCAFGFEAIPHLSCYLTSIVNKTHHEPVIALFLCNFCCSFSNVRGVLKCKSSTFIHCYWLIYFGYLTNNNTRGAFVITFLICSDLLNCLRRVDTIVITTVAKKWLKYPQSHFH